MVMLIATFCTKQISSTLVSNPWLWSGTCTSGTVPHRFIYIYDPSSLSALSLSYRCHYICKKIFVWGDWWSTAPSVWPQCVWNSLGYGKVLLGTTGVCFQEYNMLNVTIVTISCHSDGDHVILKLAVSDRKWSAASKKKVLSLCKNIDLHFWTLKYFRQRI